VADTPLLMTVPQLIEAVGGTCLCDYTKTGGFTTVVTDSRNVLSGSLFIPLLGEYQDGHVFIPKAIDAGAVVILIDETHGNGSTSLYCTLGKTHNVCFIMVKNTLYALQDAARMYVSFFPQLIKIGITGSSGKTTTKEIVASVFSQKYRVVMNEGNLNSETGLPLSVFKIRKEHEVGIFELGMNRKGEIAEIARVLSPSLAIITNIGSAHIGILGTKQAIAEEKKAIFTHFDSSCAGFIYEGDSWFDFLSDIPSGSIHAFGETKTEGYEGSKNLGIDGTLIRYEGMEIRFPFPGTYNLKNALGAVSLARYAGVSPAGIKAGIEAVKPLFGRAEVIRGKITILMDCYNANPDSMESALDFCNSLEWNGRKTYVLASMLELGEESIRAHQKICLLASKSRVDSVFLFGDEMLAAAQATDWGNSNVHLFSDIKLLSTALAGNSNSGDFIFLKGSRGMELERVVSALNVFGKSEAFHG